MNSKLVRAFIVGAVALGPFTIAFAQQGGPPTQSDRGKYEYNAHCAVCHGLSGKGDGTFAGVLRSTVPDLTALSKNNGGVFPFMRVYETIDGTWSVPAHGTRAMPVWGPRYKAEALESSFDDYPANAEPFVGARILALTEYVYRLQAK